MGKIDRAEIERGVLEYIERELLPARGRESGSVSPSASLFREGILDSFGLLALVQHLEARWGIVIRDEDMVPENFDNVDAIANFVEARR